ncbi:hypothetical protein H9P43_009484 [Blastocladiella emersonii ATCC 22665]|nr:hypothetical protein H9P43_009484 [Blastocladiella emersonii ATCC 22665]
MAQQHVPSNPTGGGGGGPPPLQQAMYYQQQQPMQPQQPQQFMYYQQQQQPMQAMPQGPGGPYPVPQQQQQMYYQPAPPQQPQMYSAHASTVEPDVVIIPFSKRPGAGGSSANEYLVETVYDDGSHAPPPPPGPPTLRHHQQQQQQQQFHAPPTLSHQAPPAPAPQPQPQQATLRPFVAESSSRPPATVAPAPAPAPAATLEHKAPAVLPASASSGTLGGASTTHLTATAASFHTDPAAAAADDNSKHWMNQRFGLAALACALSVLGAYTSFAARNAWTDATFVANFPVFNAYLVPTSALSPVMWLAGLSVLAAAATASAIFKRGKMRMAMSESTFALIQVLVGGALGLALVVAASMAWTKGKDKVTGYYTDMYSIACLGDADLVGVSETGIKMAGSICTQARTAVATAYLAGFAWIALAALVFKANR